MLIIVANMFTSSIAVKCLWQLIYLLVSSINTSTKVLGNPSGNINGCLAHVGGTSCGHTRGERMGMCGGVFRERHHLGLYRQTSFSSIFFSMDLSYLLI